MKKMNVFIAALTLAITSVAPMVSSAATTVEEPTRNVQLSKKYDSSYTLTLPSEPVNATEETVSTSVGVTAYLEYREEMTISVSSKNDWTLKDTVHKDNPEKIGYKLMAGENNLATGESSKVMSVTYKDNNEKVYTPLTFCDFETPEYAGTYADTLTFSVSVEQMPATPSGESGGTGGEAGGGTGSTTGDPTGDGTGSTTGGTTGDGTGDTGNE